MEMPDEKIRKILTFVTDAQSEGAAEAAASVVVGETA
jgi:hypothetical protein